MGTSIYQKYPIEHKFKGLKVLNLGCGLGQYKAPNVTNLDAYPICRPDVVHNLEKMPLPFEDETFDLVICNHILEHLHNWWECFEDCARVLKDNGIVEVNLPGDSSDSQMGFRDHVSLINRHSFFGVFDCSRPATNAWAMTNTPKYASRLVCEYSAQVADSNVKWLKYVPNFIRNFAVMHLRNCCVEQRMKFRKMPIEEYKKRSTVYDFNTCKPIQMR